MMEPERSKRRWRASKDGRRRCGAEQSDCSLSLDWPRVLSCECRERVQRAREREKVCFRRARWERKIAFAFAISAPSHAADREEQQQPTRRQQQCTLPCLALPCQHTPKHTHHTRTLQSDFFFPFFLDLGSDCQITCTAQHCTPAGVRAVASNRAAAKAQSHSDAKLVGGQHACMF